MTLIIINFNLGYKIEKGLHLNWFFNLINTFDFDLNY